MAAALAGMEANNRKAFDRQARESADTWLFLCSGKGDVANSSYAAFKRYIGLAIPSTMRERPRHDEQDVGEAGVVWGRDIGDFAWPAVPWEPGAGAVGACRPASCESVARSSTPTRAAASATEACDPRIRALPLKAFALQQAGRDALGPFVLETACFAQGTFGRVQRARGNTSGQEIAIKMLKDNTPIQALEELQYNVHLQTHPNINQILDVVFRGGLLGLVFPLAPLDLATFLQKKKGFLECRTFFKSALAAGSHLQSRFVIHTDIKPENFLLLPSPADTDLCGHQLKLADFGSALCAFVGARTSETRADVQARGIRVSTWSYRAPEISYGDAAFGHAVDTWSIGCTAWEVLHGKPWARDKEQQLVSTYVAYFGGHALGEVFQHHPLFRLQGHIGVKTKIFWKFRQCRRPPSGRWPRHSCWTHRHGRLAWISRGTLGWKCGQSSGLLTTSRHFMGVA